jgi:hypothetical protein
MADAIMKSHNEKEFRNKLAENAFKSAVDDFAGINWQINI